MMRVDPRPIILRGDTAIVPLTQGLHTILDASDVPLIESRIWHAHHARDTHYASVNILECGRRRQLLMHRLLLQPPAGYVVDHIDRDGLNNRRANLRLATVAENNRNRRMNQNCSSGHKGVWRASGGRGWSAGISVDKKRLHLGTFATVEAASEAYERASEKYHGKFGRVA